jgi:superoxide reductase
MKGQEQKFFICAHCGNLVGAIDNSGVKMVCCGENMTELIANTAEASKEKHLPAVVYTNDTVKVEVGSAAHPMTEEHYIRWVYLQTSGGGQRIALQPSKPPSALFKVASDQKPVAVFAYCNLHGLWKTVL